MTNPVNHSEAVEIAETAAKETLRQTFRLLGVDIDDIESVNTFRADLVHARRLRRMSEKATMAALWGGFITVGGGGLIVFWDGVRAAFGLPPT